MPTPPNPLKLFISYRSSDAPKVDKIALDLSLLRDAQNQPRYSPWQDKHNLPPASPHWWDAIVDAIEGCDVFVFHISQESLKSKVCQAELSYAHALNRPIIPIALEGEFFLNETSGKYDLLKASWPLVPEWLAERQFLFHVGADFFQRFEQAVDVFRRNWPRPLKATRPLNPDREDHTSNHARYAQACDYAERLAFVEAEKLFDALVRRNDPIYATVAAEWMELLRLYSDLIEVDTHVRTRFQFKGLWQSYRALFPKDFLDGIFDPKGFVTRSAPTQPAHEIQSAASAGLTAQQYFGRAEEYRENGDIDQAIDDYSEAIRLNPQFIEAYNGRSICYTSKQDFDQAIIDSSKAIRLNPILFVSYILRGMSYHLKRDYDLAIADFTEAIRLNPDQDNSLCLLRGESYHAKHDYDRAIADFNEAIRLNPNNFIAYYNRGVSYRHKGDYDRAIADFNEAIRLNPQFNAAKNGLRMALEDKPKPGWRLFR